MHTYYESGLYECEDKPGTFGSVRITGDNDGPCFIFASDNGDILFNLPIPACEGMAIRYGLARAIKRTMRANERDDDAHAEPPAQVTDYGPREFDPRELPPREVPGPQEPASLPHAHTDHTRALPRAVDRFLERPGYSPPASSSWPGIPQQRSA